MPVRALEVVAKLVIVLVKWYTGITASASHCGKQGRRNGKFAKVTIWKSKSDGI